MLKMFAKGERNGKPVRLVVLGFSHNNLDELRKVILVLGSRSC